MDVGQHFADYRLDAVIGRGGMGVVYEAYDEVHERRVALKLLAPALADDEHYQARFLHEARTVAGLSSPHIVPIHTFGIAQDRLYLDMALIEGHDLGQLLAQGPLVPARAVSVVEQVADALEAAHERGLVHRDVKPGNVLVTRRRADAGDFVYLCDFGLARPVAGSSGLTVTGTVLGTVDYMSPEQIEARVMDHRSDIYSLGCLLFHCLAGRPPFAGSSQVAVMDGHRSAAVPALPGEGRWGALDAVIATAMAKDSADRYPTASALAQAARAALPFVPATAPAADAEAETVAAWARRPPESPTPVPPPPVPPVQGMLRSDPSGGPGWTPVPQPAGAPQPGGPRPGASRGAPLLDPTGAPQPGGPPLGAPPPTGLPRRRGWRRPAVLVPLLVALGVVLVIGLSALALGPLGFGGSGGASSASTPSGTSPSASASGPTPPSDSAPASPTTSFTAAESSLYGQLPADLTDCTSTAVDTFGDVAATAALACTPSHLASAHVVAYSYPDEASRDTAFAAYAGLDTDTNGACPAINGSGPWQRRTGQAGGTSACYQVDDSTIGGGDGTDTAADTGRTAVMAWTVAGRPDFLVIYVGDEPSMTPAFTWHTRYADVDKG